MDIRIKATDYEMTAQVEEYLRQRIESLAKLFGDNARVEAEIGRDAGRPKHGKNIWFAELSVIEPGRERVYARNNAETVNAAIDDVKEEAERQLRKGKKLHIRVMRKTGKVAKNILRRAGEL